MDTDTDTDTDMAMVQKIRRSNFSRYPWVLLAGLLVVRSAEASEVHVTPLFGSQLTYTDNIDLSPTDEKSSAITTFEAGIGVTASGNDDDKLSFNYQLQQLLYSDDISKNGQYNELNFASDVKLLSTSNLRGSATASVSNISSSIGSNAGDDILSGKTIESRNVDLGLHYQSNPAGVVNLYARVDGTFADYEDNVGNNEGVNGKLKFSQGQSVSRYFWNTDYSYQVTRDRNTSESTISSQWDQQLGLQPVNDISPYIHWFYEDYSGQTGSDSADSSSWGPGVKYYFTKNSYISLSYEFALNSTNSNHWNGTIYLNPTSRTQVRLNYTQRFYGDAYDVSITHSNRRWVNSIAYSEKISSFNRDLYAPGAQIENLTISKQLSWSSAVNLRRTSVNLSLSADEQNAMNQVTDISNAKTYGAELSLTRKLSETTTLTPSFSIKAYRFNSLLQIPQKDYDRKLDLELKHNFAHNLQLSFAVAHTSRSSTNSSNQYEENRVNLSVRKSL